MSSDYRLQGRDFYRHPAPYDLSIGLRAFYQVTERSLFLIPLIHPLTMSKFLLLLLAASHCLARSIEIPAELKPRDIDAMIADRTCRWSNCGEQCSPGFVSVPRSGGAKDEMMWDDTQCAGRDLARLCCPANAPQPTCTWRGHHNKKCTGGCRDGEAEVWTTNKACKAGYQSACCTTNTPSVEAYSNCQWQGSAPKCWESFAQPDKCDAHFPTLAVQSVIQFGGGHVCKQGTHLITFKIALPCCLELACYIETFDLTKAIRNEAVLLQRSR